MSAASYVLVDHPTPEVAVVTLNRPERMNSMAFDVMVPFRDALAEVGADNDVRAVVLTGAGRGFCSGADQSGETGRVPDVDGLTPPTVALRAMELLEDLVTTIRGLHQPVVAAVNGPAIGGGLCLALACDIRVAAPSAYFRAAGINNGLTASELGLSYLLPRAIGSSRAFEVSSRTRSCPRPSACMCCAKLPASSPDQSVRFVSSTPGRLNLAIRAPSPTQCSTSASDPTTSDTSPMRAASSAPTSLPVSMTSNAREEPMARGSR